jgi:antitoxin (DNA-binding transcriptional repressor) of toxin-antitoxin stability system
MGTQTEQTMPAKTIDVQKDVTDLKGLLSLVADGNEILLTEGDTPVARLIPIGWRVAGLHAGAIRTSEDFDEPLPEQFWTGSP